MTSDSENRKQLREAAKQGNRDAQYTLGLAFLYGEAVGKDAIAALEWLPLAAKPKHPEAQFALGDMYHDDPTA